MVPRNWETLPAVTGSQLPLTGHMTSDMTSYMICDITSDMTSKITYEITPDRASDMTFNRTYVDFFLCVFNDIKSNKTSDRLSVLTSKRTKYVTSGHLNVTWYDIQQDICLVCVQQVSGHFVTLILEIHIRCNISRHMKRHLTWNLIWHSTGHFFSISLLVSGNFVRLNLAAKFLSDKHLPVGVLHGIYLLRLTSLFGLCFLCAQSIIFSVVNATLWGTTLQIIHWASPFTKSWIAPKPCCHLKAFSWAKWGPTLLLWSRIFFFFCVAN